MFLFVRSVGLTLFAGMVFSIHVILLFHWNDVHSVFSVQRSMHTVYCIQNTVQQMKITKYKMNIRKKNSCNSWFGHSISTFAVIVIWYVVNFSFAAFTITSLPLSFADKNEDCSLFSQQVFELCLSTLLIDTKWNVHSIWDYGVYLLVTILRNGWSRSHQFHLRWKEIK